MMPSRAVSTTYGLSFRAGQRLPPAGLATGATYGMREATTAETRKAAAVPRMRLTYAVLVSTWTATPAARAPQPTAMLLRARR